MHVDTPECDKLSAVIETQVAILDFLDWLGQRGIWLGRFTAGADFLAPIDESKNALLNSYFEIDGVMLEKERRALIEAAVASRE